MCILPRFPGVVSMAIGEGHTHYGRYASGRGANPLSILAPVWEKSTGVSSLRRYASAHRSTGTKTWRADPVLAA
jgi:hypothetical protein